MPKVLKVSFLILSGAVLGFAALFVVKELVQAYVSVQKLLVIEDPEAFAASFVDIDKTAVDLAYASRFLDLENGYIESPLFPYSELKALLVVRGDGCQEESRFLLIDERWKVFWIDIEKCRPSKLNTEHLHVFSPSELYYGPFRIGNPAAESL